MSKYRITIDGKTYELEIELIAGNGVPQPVAARDRWGCINPYTNNTSKTTHSIEWAVGPLCNL